MKFALMTATCVAAFVANQAQAETLTISWWGYNGEKLQAMADAGQIEVHEFAGRDKMLELVQPVQDAYAAELGATELLENIRGM